MSCHDNQALKAVGMSASVCQTSEALCRDDQDLHPNHLDVGDGNNWLDHCESLMWLTPKVHPEVAALKA
jgi:hypothetical protein